MREGEPKPSAEDQWETVGEAIEPSVPVPDDFPDNPQVSRPPGKTIEEQRRELEDSEDRGVKKRHGGLSNPVHRM